MNWRTIFASLKSRDMQKRLLAVFAIIIIYRFLAHVPVPLAEPAELKQVLENSIKSTDLGGFLNLLSGGGLASLSIVLVGLSPYITASVIAGFLRKPYRSLKSFTKHGESGRRKINQWTRIITVPLAVLQSIAFIFIIRQTVLAGNTGVLSDTTLYEWVIAVTAMATGAILMMSLQEYIDGVGNGISLLIFAGIISQLPSTLGGVWSSVTTVANDSEKLHVFNWFTLPVNALAFWVSRCGRRRAYGAVCSSEDQRSATCYNCKLCKARSG